MFSIIHGFRVIFCPKEIESEPVSPRIFFLALLLWVRIYDPKLHGVTIVGERERLPKKDIQSPLSIEVDSLWLKIYQIVSFSNIWIFVPKIHHKIYNFQKEKYSNFSSKFKS